MANFAGIVSDDPAVRDAFLSSAETVMAPFEGLSRGRGSHENLALAWAAPGAFPAEFSTQPGGSVFSFGSREEDYFASIKLLGGRLSLGADALSLFPVYYVCSNGSIAFASSPHLLMRPPEFKKEIDEEALSMSLLLGVILEGRSLLKPLKRVRQGTHVEWSRQSGAVEVPDTSLEPNDRYFGETFEQNFERIDGLLDERVRRGVSAGVSSMLMSGGLDSRLIAGYADRAGVRLLALTQGDERDFEMRIARQVTGALGWNHVSVDYDPALMELTALLKIDHEFVSGGFHVTPFPQLVESLRANTTAVFSGGLGDSTVGCAELDDDESWGYDFDSHLANFSEVFFSADEARRLLRPKAAESIGVVHERLRRRYEGFSGSPFQKAWRFDREVDSVKNMFMRYFAFGARPVFPYLHRGVISAICGMPAAHLRGRRMQREILFRRFQKLALLPLDRNGYSFPPALGPKRVLKQQGLRAGERVRNLVGHFSNAVSAPVREWTDRVSGSERRFYFRALGMNQGGWHALRARAIREADRLDPWMNVGELKRILTSREDFERSQRIKLLTGIVIWHQMIFG